MSERFTIEIELRGIDDASDELKSVSEKLKAVGASVDEASKASGKAQERIQLLNEALRDNKITAIQSGEAVEETLKKSRASAATFKALSEQTKVFSDRSEFMVKQLNNIASVGGKLNSMFNSVNTLMTRVQTTQMNYNMALERQRDLIAELSAKYGVTATSVEELRNELLMKIEVLETAEEQSDSMRAQLKMLQADLRLLEQSDAVTKASEELAAAQAQIPAQMAAIGLQADQPRAVDHGRDQLVQHAASHAARRPSRLYGLTRPSARSVWPSWPSASSCRLSPCTGMRSRRP